MKPKAVATSERTLPSNLEAERALLGAVIVHNAALDVVDDILDAKAFYRQAHGTIWQAITGLREARTRIDFVTLKNELARENALDDVGGAAYIASLVDGVPSTANAEHYAHIVKEKAQLRGLIYAANTLLTEAYDADRPAQDILADADRQFVSLSAQSRGTMQGVSTTGLFSDLEARIENKGQITGVPTGFDSINDLTSGWQAGDLVVLAARPSIGKTSFAANTAVAAARSGTRVAFFSLEMRRRQIEYRLWAQLSGVTLARILAGNLGQGDYANLSHALAELDAIPLEIDDRGGQTAGDIRSTCRRMRSEKAGLGLVVIDYVQLMTGSTDRRGATRNEEISDISRRLKLLAGDVGAPILLLSQLSRAGKDRSDARPRLSDLRDSGALEQDADTVVLLHRESHRSGGTTHAIFEKQRNGPTGALNLTFDRERTTFTDGGDDPPPPTRRKRDTRTFGPRQGALVNDAVDELDN